jgi:bacillithiol biosynthesis cysteine-adding enzyme BshC
MSKTIETLRFNKIYQDFVSGNLKDLPDPTHVDWTVISRQILPANPIQQKAKETLRNQNADLSSEKAQMYLSALDDPDTQLIFTGQQLGLFLSPIYTIYKAITVIKLVEKLNTNNGTKYIPVFWLESEDHDFAEVNHFGIWDSSMHPQVVKYAGKDDGKKSVRHYKLTDDIHSCISELKEYLIETEFSPDLFSALEKTYKEGTGWLSATRELFKNLFHDQGLLFFEPGHPEIKEISAPFFVHLLENSENISGEFQKKSEQMVDAGYFNQVKALSGRTFVHVEDTEQNRMHIRFEDGRYLRDNENSISRNEIRSYVDKNIQKISTTVISRPILQSWLFPVAAYIAGPAEVAYWSQLSTLFSKFNLSVPVVYPRISLTLIEPKIDRFISKQAIDITKIEQKKQDFLDDCFAARSEKGEDPFIALKSSLSQAKSNITGYLKLVDPTLIASSEKILEKIQHQIDVLAQKAVQAQQRKEQTVTNQLEQVHHSIFPEGVPQERFISIVYFLNKYGPGFVTDLIDKMELNNFQHQIIEIGQN